MPIFSAYPTSGSLLLLNGKLDKTEFVTDQARQDAIIAANKADADAKDLATNVKVDANTTKNAKQDATLSAHSNELG